MAVLTVLTIIVILHSVIAPAFIFWRIKTTGRWDAPQAHDDSWYTTQRVLIKLAILVLVEFLWLGGLIALFLSVINSDLSIISQSHILMWISLSFLISLLIIATGSGLYDTAVIAEDYIHSDLATHSTYSHLRIPLSLLHGAISHLFVYGGTLLALLFLSLLEIYSGVALQGSFVWFGLLAVLFGLVFAGNQVLNGTARHYIPLLGFLLIVHLSMLGIGNLPLMQYPLTVFVLLVEVIVFSGCVMFRSK